MWPNLLGLDSPAVAVAWQWLFARVFGADLPPVFHLILGLSVWCVYLADRLYDATRAPQTDGQTDRLRFTQQHFTALSVVALTVGTVNFFLILQHVPRPLMVTGLLTAGLLAIYYILRIKASARLASILPREILCGMIFGLGSVIAPHAFLPPGGGSGFFPAALLLGLVCAASCTLISVWEKAEDIAGNDRSIATLPSKIIPHVSHVLTVLILLTVAMAFIGPWRIYLAVAASALALRGMLRFERHFSQRALRVLADAVLLTPLIFLVT